MATFPPRPGGTAMGAWRGLLVRLLFSCPWAAPFPSSQTLESAGPRPHARWQRLPTPQPTEADVTWAWHGCRPFSALPCLLDPGERCRHQARTAPHEGSSLRRGPAAGAPWEMGSEQKKRESVLRPRGSPCFLPRCRLRTGPPTALCGSPGHGAPTPPLQAGGGELLDRKPLAHLRKMSERSAHPDSSSFFLGFRNEIKCTQLLPVSGPPHPRPPKLRGEPHTLGPTPHTPRPGVCPQLRSPAGHTGAAVALRPLPVPRLRQAHTQARTHCSPVQVEL